MGHRLIGEHEEPKEPSPQAIPRSQRQSMKTLLFMSITGATLYGLIVVAHHILPQQNPAFPISAKDNSDANRTLRSWGRNLPALVVQSRQGDANQNAAVTQAAVANSEANETKLAGAKTSVATAALNSPIDRAVSKPNSIHPIPLSSKQQTRSARFDHAKGKSVDGLRRDRWVGSNGGRRRFGLFGRRFASSFGATW